MESRVIFLVLTMVIVGALAVLSFQVLQKARFSIADLWKRGESFERKINPIDLYSACGDWLAAGSEAYNSKEILETFKLFDYMRPYSELWRGCGSIMEDLAKECSSGSGKRYCNGYYIEAEELRSCVIACENIRRIYELCKSSCEDNLISCFNSLIDYAGREICKSKVSFSSRVIEKACGG